MIEIVVPIIAVACVLFHRHRVGVRLYRGNLQWVTDRQLEQLRDWANAGDSRAAKLFDDVLDHRAARTRRSKP